MGLLDGLFGGGETPDKPRRVNAGKEAFLYLFGKDDDRTHRDIQGITDSRIWDQLLGVESTYRPEWQRLNQEEQERALFGPLGILDQQRRATEYAGQTASDAAQYQRERDLADVGAMAPGAVRINRESDPQRAAMMAQQQALTDEIFGRAFGLTPQQQRQATQTAREASAARGRTEDNSSIAAEVLSREEELRKNRMEALNAGNSMFGQYQATSVDPWSVILGRGSTAPGMAAQSQLSAQGLLGAAVPGLFDPDTGIDLGLQHQANKANYGAAVAGANAAQGGALGGGLLGGVGSILGGLFG